MLKKTKTTKKNRNFTFGKKVSRDRLERKLSEKCITPWNYTMTSSLSLSLSLSRFRSRSRSLSVVVFKHFLVQFCFLQQWSHKCTFEIRWKLGSQQRSIHYLHNDRQQLFQTVLERPRGEWIMVTGLARTLGYYSSDLISCGWVETQQFRTSKDRKTLI